MLPKINRNTLLSYPYQFFIHRCLVRRYLTQRKLKNTKTLVEVSNVSYCN